MLPRAQGAACEYVSVVQPRDRCGSFSTKLLIIRGNSGSGKSSVAREVRQRYGRGCALIEQDYLRRIVLRELDQPGGIAPELIEETARFALDRGYHAIVEGILHTARNASMLRRLIAAHAGTSYVYYLDVSFDETVRRHLQRPQADTFTADQMRDWYVPHDVLGVAGEHTIAQTSAFDATIEAILATSDLLSAPSVVPAGTPA
jgi:adenylate kinase family enzyme